jgi:hypothetical protein
MTQPDRASALRRAYALMREGNREEARAALRPILQAYPNDADAWTLASMLVDDPARKEEMLWKALSANPNHARATAELEKLATGAQPAVKRQTGTLDAAGNKRTSESQPSAAMKEKRKSNTGIILIAAALGMLALVVVVVVVLQVTRSESANFVVPTVFVPDTAVPPTSTQTLEPTHNETPVPTMTNTPAPFGYTATADWQLYQTEAANFRVTLTAAALIPQGAS